MPKLNPAKAAEVAKAGEEGSKFSLLPIGKYVCKLTDVESTTSKKDDPMWIWTFRILEFLDGELKDEQGKPFTLAADRELRYYTVIKDNTLWDLDRVFGAFDAEPNVDTDTLIGDEIVLMIDQEIISGGKSKGKMGNYITDFMTVKNGKAKDEFEELVTVGAPKGEDDEPPF